MNKTVRKAWLGVLIGGAAIYAQPVFTGPEIFPAEEFAARRARVMDRIGQGVAIIQGTTERPGEQPLRQANQFFYLTGVVEPRAIIDCENQPARITMMAPNTQGRIEIQPASSCEKPSPA